MRGRAVTLRDGRVVDSYSEAWRAECEARMVAGWPTRKRRVAYLQKVAEVRGSAAADALRRAVVEIFNAERASSALAPARISGYNALPSTDIQLDSIARARREAEEARRSTPRWAMIRPPLGRGVERSPGVS